MKKIIYAVLLLLFLVPIKTVAQDEPIPLDPEIEDFDYYADKIEFLQGKGIIEEWFTDGFLPQFDTFMKSKYEALAYLGQVIAGIAALCYLGFLGFGMVMGEREWDVMPMLKPFALGLILMNWVDFVSIVQVPTKELGKYAQTEFHDQQVKLTVLRIKRFQKQDQVIDVLFDKGAEAEVEKRQSEEGSVSMAEGLIEIGQDVLTSLGSPIAELYLRLQVRMSMVVSMLVETIALWVLRLAVYCMFFIQLIFSTILILVGPISIAISIFPMFSSSFGNWLSKFINVNLYTFMIYIVLQIGTLLQTFAMEAEIKRYELIVDSTGEVIDNGLLFAFANSSILSFGMVVVSFLISAVGVLMVPTMAGFVVSSGGASSAVGKAGRVARAVATQGKSLLAGK